MIIVIKPGFVFQKAMEDLGLRSEEITDILKVCAAVLKLGNLQFVPITNMDGTEGCGIANEYGQYIIYKEHRQHFIALLSQNSTMCLNY